MLLGNIFKKGLAKVAANCRRHPLVCAAVTLVCLSGGLVALSLVALLALGVPASWGDHTPGFLTRPPQMPVNYLVFDGGAYDCVVIRVASQSRSPGYLASSTIVVPANVLRIGVAGAVVFGVRADVVRPPQGPEDALRRVGFVLDTAAAEPVVREVPLSDLEAVVGAAAGPGANTRTVPSRFYKHNKDGGMLGVN